MNCEDERFEKRSSEEEDEARSDEDYAHMDDSDYDYDDFVVADDDVSMLTDASSYSSERGRVKRRRLKRARSASSSSSEIHISVEEEESIDEDQPRRKRRRIDDDLVPDPVQVKADDINHSSPLLESGGTNEAPKTAMADNNDIMDTKEVVVETKPVDFKPADPNPVVAVETTADNTIEVRTKKRKRSKRKDAQQVTSSDSVPASQCTPVSAKSEGAAETKVEGNTTNTIASSVASPKQNDVRPVTRPIENNPKSPVTNNMVAAGETKKKKKRKKKNRPNAEISLAQSTNGTSSQASSLPKPHVIQSSNSSDAVNATVPQKKKKKNKKKKGRINSELSLSQSTNGTSSQVSSLPTPHVVQPTSASSTDAIQVTLPKKKKRNKKKKNRPSVEALPTQGTNGTSSQASSLPKPPALQSTNSGTTAMVPVAKKKNNKKKKNGLTATNTIVAQGVSNPRVPLNAAPSKSAVQNISNGYTDIKKEHKVVQKSVDKLLPTNGEIKIKVDPTLTMVQKNQANNNNDKMRDKKQKKSKKNKPSSGAVNGGTSDPVRLSFEEKRSAEERYQRLKNLIAQM